MLASPQVGDLVVVPVTGAYCFTMANNYNAALRPPVILCSNGTARLAVRRETYEDLTAREIGLPRGPRSRRHFHDHLDLSSLTHGSAPGLP